MIKTIQTWETGILHSTACCQICESFFPESTTATRSRPFYHNHRHHLLNRTRAEPHSPGHTFNQIKVFHCSTKAHSTLLKNRQELEMMRGQTIFCSLRRGPNDSNHDTSSETVVNQDAELGNLCRLYRFQIITKECWQHLRLVWWKKVAVNLLCNLCWGCHKEPFVAFASVSGTLGKSIVTSTNTDNWGWSLHFFQIMLIDIVPLGPVRQAVFCSF